MAVAPLTTAVARPSIPGALPVGIAGLGAVLPERVVTNADLATGLDTSDEWIRERTGIRQRHVADPSEATSDLAVRAATAALADSGLAVDDVDVVIVATTSPDHRLPATAPLVARALGTNVAALDLNAACSGFVYGLQVAASLVASGGFRTVLLIGAEVLTRIVDQSDRATAVLFGDGAGAVVLTPDERGGIGPFDLGVDGELADLLVCPAGGTRRPSTQESVAAGDEFLRMSGREVYRHAVMRMVASSRAVLAAAGLGIDDVDLVVGHQANARILDAVLSRLGVPPERTHMTVDRHANTSAASIPLALADARDQGRLSPGDRVLLTAFGGGLTWGSTLVTWPAGGVGDE